MKNKHFLQELDELILHLDKLPNDIKLIELALDKEKFTEWEKKINKRSSDDILGYYNFESEIQPSISSLTLTRSGIIFHISQKFNSKS